MFFDARNLRRLFKWLRNKREVPTLYYVNLIALCADGKSAFNVDYGNGQLKNIYFDHN